ncbi:MAG: hypothetical protein ACI89L_000304 [Phycisphaerales bacterium]|jgi:hypothetical protein
MYEISNVDEMPPFLMTVVGDSDLWMYLSTSGALAAGRVSPERCLFPYETDDRLHVSGGLTGPVTMVRLPGGELWRPLEARPITGDRTRRLLRTPVGDAVIMEETDHASGLTFRAEWSLSDAHGLVRRCELELGEGTLPIEIELLDGVVNVMPPNVPLGLQQAASTLVDGYKRSELDQNGTLAIYALEATISDRPEPSESLHANVIWRSGLAGASVSLDGSAVRDFELGRPVNTERLNTGRRGAYLCVARLTMAPGATQCWVMAGDVHLDHAAVERRRRWLASTADHAAAVERDLVNGAERLAVLLDQADGAQRSSDESACAAHRSNTLFNAMRGGVPADGYRVETADLRRFVRSRHAAIADRHDAFLAGLGETRGLGELAGLAQATGDPQLVRLMLEYLPLTFGRRHGDPSRPWNRFRIKTRHADGSRALAYEGNWRDIFQNWEAVCRSYPAMLPGVIAKFVNASTMDGHNPYRISENGIDWEVVEPEEPFANIGYWGDHQVVYLLRLLEQLRDTDPGALEGMLERPIFSYADVPYRILPFDDLVRNPRASVLFDAEHDAAVRARAALVGGDGLLVPGDTGSAGENGEPRLVTLVEKLLVTALAKVSNLVPGGGIWMNTQRPEWNDANNALAGHGLSMVTLYQLRRYADFCARVLEGHAARSGHAAQGDDETPISAAIAAWCDRVVLSLGGLLGRLEGQRPLGDSGRWAAMEELGRAAQASRDRIAKDGLGRAGAYALADVVEFFRLTVRVCDHSIGGARRADGLYESYRVLHLDTPGGASVESLQPMLEGQVAVLSAGVLGGDETLGVLEALFASELYREDLGTFMLYPRVDRADFLDRNVIPEDAVRRSLLLRRLLREDDRRVVVRDDSGRARFGADLITRGHLRERLAELGGDPAWSELVAQDTGEALASYEQTFAHSRFTGRSGTMHKYEGLGSVYWHMVSKLLLATQESVFAAVDRGEDGRLVARLSAMYERVREGLGLHKTPGVFGAVPHEPYSHSPWRGGAQQPGMTGQVKEGFLARLGELGVRLINGEIRFVPVLFDRGELLAEPADWRVRGVTDQRLRLEAGSIGFSVCGVPVVMKASGKPDDKPSRDSVSDSVTVSVVLDNGAVVGLAGASLGPGWTREVLGRTGRVARIQVDLLG